MKPDLSHRFRQQAVSLVLFFAAVAAVFALAGLSKDPAKKQAEFVVQQLLSCSSAVEQAVDAAAPAGSEPGLAAVDTDGLYAFLQAQLGDAMTADWAHLPYEFLGKVSNDIINKVKGVNRVTYDISSKPPSTIEWE